MITGDDHQKRGGFMARSGTEKRQRTHVITARFNQKEAETIRAMAAKSGLSVASLFRTALLKAEPPRAVRRPTIDHKAVAQVLGQLGSLKGEINKIGSNLNQLTKYANMGRTLEGSIEAVLHQLMPLFERDLSELRHVCLHALGQEPERPEPETD
jgi:hypothetical protein